MNGLSKYLMFRGFWAQRAQFYRDAALSEHERELFRDFLEGEYQIAVAPATRNPSRAAAIKHMRALMEQGITGTDQLLSAVMPASDALGISVIVDAKDKAASLGFVADNVQEQAQMTKIVRTALASPIVLLPVAFVFSYIMASRVIPAFEKAAPPEVWFGFSALVRDVSFAVRDWGPLVMLLIVAALGWFSVHGLANITHMWRYKCESATGWSRFAWFLLGPVNPMLVIYRDIQSARMLANLATLIQGGRGVQDSLRALGEKSTPWMRKHLMWVLEHLQLMPGDYVGAFGHGILSSYALGRMHTMVRRDSGHDFAGVLIDIGTTGQTKAREQVQAYATRINGVLLALIFTVILFFMAGQNWIVMQVQDQLSPSNIQKRAIEKQQKATVTPLSATQ
jgi:hypothetical protein